MKLPLSVPSCWRQGPGEETLTYRAARKRAAALPVSARPCPKNAVSKSCSASDAKLCLPRSGVIGDGMRTERGDVRGCVSAEQDAPLLPQQRYVTRRVAGREDRGEG
jgi:hypothetical protein